LSLQAAIWREVGRHVELGDAVRRIAPLLREEIPAEALVVRAVKRDPLRLITVATGACGSSHGVEGTPVLSEIDVQTEPRVEQLLRGGRVELLERPQDDGLLRVLLPANPSTRVLVGPLVARDEPLGLLVLVGERLGSEHLAAAQGLLEPLTVALENDQRLHELARMREALEADRQALLSRLDRQDISDTIVGATTGLRSVMERCEQVARTEAPVLILGETGSGKEVIARAIHAGSRRARGPIVRINCGAIPPELIDSELFGHERGSFTGAIATRKGWFERADGGTLFLDEIGELPLAAQVRLLRVLQDGSLERVGGHGSITVDVRIVAATNRNLETMVAEGKFREDLWYRISVFPIRLPPLRERQGDIAMLSAHFARRAGQRLGGAALTPSESDLARLRAYGWPGNVRELSAVIERAAILGDGKRLEVAKALGTFEPGSPPATDAMRPPQSAAPPRVEAVRVSGQPSATSVQPLDEAIRSHIASALEATHGRIEGPFGAAKLLGVNPFTLRARMRKLGIDWARYRDAGDE
jgi:transcriptional regulator with GAF, ATPase, and Fis domain